MEVSRHKHAQKIAAVKSKKIAVEGNIGMCSDIKLDVVYYNYYNSNSIII